MASIITHSDQVPRLSSLKALPPPRKVLMAEPKYFNVEYVINPHMQGHVGQINFDEAWRQWEIVRKSYERLGIETHVLPGVQGLPDLVFCANQTLPYLDAENGTNGVVLSTMYATQRKPEVDHVAHFFRHVGYTTTSLPGGGLFEGMGDALWHPAGRLLFGGYGFRTDLRTYEYLSKVLQTPIIPLHLNDPDFYHLDTCLSVLDEESALYVPQAFDAAGLALLKAAFPRLIEVPEYEGRRMFAANAHCPDKRHVIIQKGCTETCARLKANGFFPIEVDTSEFMKSGGSVFCMKMMFW